MDKMKLKRAFLIAITTCTISAPIFTMTDTAVNETNSLGLQAALVAHEHSYIELLDTLALSKEAVIPKHIIATEAELRCRAYINAMHALFTTYPDHELVVDFEAAKRVNDYFGYLPNGYFPDHYPILPSSLRNISIVGENLTIVGDEFLTRTCLRSVTISNGVTTIRNNFLMYGSLRSIAIPNSVTTIGDRFLWNCPFVTSVTIPNGVTTIGTYFLHNCSGLTSVTIPDSVTTIGDFFLTYCLSLTSVTIPRRFQDSVRHLPSTVQIIFNNDMGTLENNDIGTLEIDKNLGRNDAI
ncbi:MAG: leucine-rich repeat domain-containing protein [Pseudomonadota bacterium]